MKTFCKVSLYTLLFSCIVCQLTYTTYLKGCYYFAGWHRFPVPVQYLVNGCDWRFYFPEREPVLGWYDDRQYIIDQEIVFAANAGIDFFAFDNYFFQETDTEPGSMQNINNGINFYLTSPNQNLLKFAVNYINGGPPFAITTSALWQTAIATWISYFQNPQYATINGNPVMFFFSALALETEWGGLAGAQNALAQIRTAAANAGFPTIYIGGLLVNPGGSSASRALSIGYDFLTQYSTDPSLMLPGANEYSTMPTIQQTNWNRFVGKGIAFAPTVIQNFDTRPQANVQNYYINPSPTIFTQELTDAKNFIDSNPALWVGGVELLMFYAWNELEAGGIFTPTLSWGTSYVNQIGVIIPG